MPIISRRARLSCGCCRPDCRDDRANAVQTHGVVAEVTATPPGSRSTPEVTRLACSAPLPMCREHYVPPRTFCVGRASGIREYRVTNDLTPSGVSCEWISSFAARQCSTKRRTHLRYRAIVLSVRQRFSRHTRSTAGSICDMNFCMFLWGDAAFVRAPTLNTTQRRSFR
jgi:hypothetical protein